MLADFERALADVLGARLPPPLAGAVDVVPGRDVARLLVSVGRVEPLDGALHALHARRAERVPGAPAARRVLRLQGEVTLALRAPDAEARPARMDAFDDTLYLLGDPALADGTALLPADASDPGFLVHALRLVRAEPPTTIVLAVEGVFWPVGVAGEDGPAIVAARLRQVVQPLRLAPERPPLVAAGEAVELTLHVGAAGALGAAAGGATTALPFGGLVVRVVDAGGRPGAGTLAGGAAAADGARLVDLADGVATVRYTPPDAPTVEHLVVQLDDGAGEGGVEVGRFRLAVRGG